MSKPDLDLDLSVVVIAYDMPREIPRTVQSLSPRMQRGIARNEYELIVVDNGSKRRFDEELCRSFGADIRFLHHKSSAPSPCEAINLGLSQARGRLCGVWIDGARLASPGILAGALAASSLHPRSIVSTLGFHLGHLGQHKSVHFGYDQAEEDRLLDSVDWTADGYRLFDISSFAGSSQDGWFAPMAESNALFLPTDLWRELGGYDERFRTPGGGLTNLDVYKRACELPDSQLVTLLGEGTFHQIHGGVMTNAQVNRRALYREEYEQIRGRPFERSTRSSLFFGSIPRETLRTIASSAEIVPDETAPRPVYRRQGTLREAVVPIKKGWFASVTGGGRSVVQTEPPSISVESSSKATGGPTVPAAVDPLTRQVYDALVANPRMTPRELQEAIPEIRKRLRSAPIEEKNGSDREERRNRRQDERDS